LLDLLWYPAERQPARNLRVRRTLKVPTWSWAKMRGGEMWTNTIDKIENPVRKLRNFSVLRTDFETNGPTLSVRFRRQLFRSSFP